MTQLPNLQKVHAERCFKPPNWREVRHDLHVFCGASERDYVAVAYLRTEDISGEIHCSFEMGKARLCPLKKVTIPRLELMSAVLVVELGQAMIKELRYPIGEVTYWTDSTSVLQYISNESRRFLTFVAIELPRYRMGAMAVSGGMLISILILQTTVREDFTLNKYKIVADAKGSRLSMEG